VKLENYGAFDYNNRIQYQAQEVEQDPYAAFNFNAQQENILTRCGIKGGTDP